MSGGGLRVGRWTIPETELEERFDTAGGPGGQHANRNRTAVTLRFEVGSTSLPAGVRDTLVEKLGTVVEVTAADSPSQWRNRSVARRRLTEKLEEALVEHPRRRTTRPSKASKENRLRAKRSRSELKKTRRRPDPE